MSLTEQQAEAGRTQQPAPESLLFLFLLERQLFLPWEKGSLRLLTAMHAALWAPRCPLLSGAGNMLFRHMADSCKSLSLSSLLSHLLVTLQTKQVLVLHFLPLHPVFVCVPHSHITVIL